MNLNNKYFFILYLLIFLGSGISVQAQENNILVNSDWDHERHSWNAWWISHPEAPVFDYGVMLFRKSFPLDRVPDSLLVYVSADNRYRLWVNEIPVLSGPARGDFMNWNYEEINIAPYLRVGINTLAVQVNNLGKYRPVAQFSRQTALILKGEGLLGDSLKTDGDWKVMAIQAYSPIPVTKTTVRGFYVAGPTDYFEAEKYPWGWQSVKYNDSEWKFAVPVSIGAGRGYMHGIPWHLVPRNIPAMEERITRFPSIRKYSGNSPEPFFLQGNNSWTVPAKSHSTLLLDQGELTVGYPEIIFSRGKGSHIKITYAESLYDSLFRKGNRNDVDGKSMIGYYDVILPDGGANRTFRPLWIRTWRYVQLEIITAGEDLELQDFYGIFTAYPFTRKAEFITENKNLNAIWEAGWRTARLCAGETYMDCPYYEQLQYVGDTRIQALISLNLTDDDRLMRNAIQQINNSRIPEGLTLGRAPSFIPQVTPPFSLYWIDMVHDYWMYRSDDQFVFSMLPGIEAILTWFERRIDSSGMVGALDWFNFSDWTPGFQVGAPVAVDTGQSTLLSLNFVYALQNASEIFRASGNMEKAKYYSDLSASLSESTRKNCYNAELNLLRDAPGSDVYSQHSNIFGILTGIFKETEKESVLSKIIHEPGLIQTTVYFKFYLFEAIRGTRFAGDYLEMLEPWDEMLKLGLTTFREDDYEDRSDCHAWSASPLYHMISLVAGIRPGSPGYKTVVIEPAPGKLPRINCVAVHPRGIIRMDISFLNSGKAHGIVELPPGVNGEFRFCGKVIELHGGQQQIIL